MAVQFNREGSLQLEQDLSTTQGDLAFYCLSTDGPRFTCPSNQHFPSRPSHTVLWQFQWIRPKKFRIAYLLMARGKKKRNTLPKLWRQIILHSAPGFVAGLHLVNLSSLSGCKIRIAFSIIQCRARTGFIPKSFVTRWRAPSHKKGNLSDLGAFWLFLPNPLLKRTLADPQIYPWPSGW